MYMGDSMKIVIGSMMQFVLLVIWLAGVVIAKGFISVTAAMVVPPYAWYLVVEKIMIVQGWVI